MGTISDKLMRIINTKEDIRQALISKGYDVPTSIPFKEYAKMILDLPCKADSFPDIEGIVARYSASGITNEQMAANPVWVDKTGNFEGTDVLHVGKLAPTNVGTCINAAIWELVFLDHDATEEELTKIKDYFVKTYPWLFPDQAWTVVGKTNEDEDRATIANITGNGNDLVLSNFGFIEGSGYNEEGEHAGYLVTDGVDDMITSSAFQMGKDFTIVGDWKFIDNKKSGTGLVKGSSFYIYNTMIGLDLYINSGSVKNSLDGIKSINAACSDGRAYDRNWNEILANTGNVVGSGGILEVSSSGGRFDRIAFKNLAIYPRILSKDDCIKAYNYLQTLKSK